MIKNIRKSITIKIELWEAAMNQAGKIHMSLSGVIKRLLTMWLDGKIKLWCGDWDHGRPFKLATMPPFNSGGPPCLERTSAPGFCSEIRGFVLYLLSR